MGSLKRYAATIPCVDQEVDYTPFVALVHHPEFQILAKRRQLGGHVPRVFPGGQHSRFEHSLGVFHRTGQALVHLVRRGCVEKTQKNVLLAHALTHDVGHGPLSHGIEPVTSISHKENGVRTLALFEETLASIGVPVSRLVAMMEKRDPLGAIVSDKRLGTDLLDYLRRDAHHIGKSVSDASTVSSQLVYEDGELGIEEAAVPEAVRLMQDYAYMYQRVYLATLCRLYERITAKMVAALLANGLKEDDLWRMTDAELDGAFERSEEPTVRFLYRRYRANARMRAVAVFCPEDTSPYQTMNGDVEAVREIMDFPTDLTLQEAHRLADELERRAAEVLGLEENGVIVVPPIERRRFVPKDVTVWSHGKRKSMRLLYPEAFQGIEGIYRQDAGFRFCVWDGGVAASHRLEDLMRATRGVFLAKDKGGAGCGA